MLNTVEQWHTFMKTAAESEESVRKMLDDMDAELRLLNGSHLHLGKDPALVDGLCRAQSLLHEDQITDVIMASFSRHRVWNCVTTVRLAANILCKNDKNSEAAANAEQFCQQFSSQMQKVM